MSNDNVIEFPGNTRSQAFADYIRRCGRPSPITGEPCYEPAGHKDVHATAPNEAGMSVSWWDMSLLGEEDA